MRVAVDVDQLHRLFETAEHIPGGGVEAHERHEALKRNGKEVHTVFYKDSQLLFTGEALELLYAIEDRYAKPSLEQGGYAKESIRALAVKATKMSIDDTDAAVRSFILQLGEAPRQHKLVESFDGYFPGTKLTLGRCDLHNSLESIVPKEDFDVIPHVAKDYKGPVLVTTVLARDIESARLRARDNFDQAKAIAALLSDTTELRLGPMLRLDVGTSHIGTEWAGGGRLIVGLVDRSGQLYPGYRQLSEAAGHSPGEQTDWARRTLSATRWYYQARTAGWPTAELSAYMSALECLCIADTSKRGKGRQIVDRINALRSGTDDADKRQLRQWLEHLYKHRNNALHEGIWFLDETQVTRLRDLTRSVIGWAASHLDPWHTGRARQVCESFADAHRLPHYAPEAPRSGSTPD